MIALLACACKSDKGNADAARSQQRETGAGTAPGHTHGQEQHAPKQTEQKTYTSSSTSYTGEQKDGKKDGPWVVLGEDGQKIMEHHYKDGKKHGSWKNWGEDGKMSSEYHYKDGQRDGSWTEWYDNGQKCEEGHYKNGKKDGLWIMWSRDGQKLGETRYKADKVIR